MNEPFVSVLPLMSKRETISDDYDLMCRVAGGDETAFRKLFEKYNKKVFLYLYRLIGDRDYAEDILVETFTVVWKSAKKFRGDSKASTWLLGIARNLAMNHLKKIRYEEDIDDYKNKIKSNGIINEELWEKRDILKKALMRLSAKHREVLDLVFYQELSYPEISEILDVPVNTVKTRVFYAKGELKKILHEMGVERDVI